MQPDLLLNVKQMVAAPFRSWSVLRRTEDEPKVGESTLYFRNSVMVVLELGPEAACPGTVWSEASQGEGAPHVSTWRGSL